MSHVYVIQDFGTWNLTPAMEFGKIKVLLPARRQIIFSSAPTVNRLREQLREITDDDYLLLSGDPAAKIVTGKQNFYFTKLHRW